jgi:hypothetical protein
VTAWPPDENYLRELREEERQELSDEWQRVEDARRLRLGGDQEEDER